jgi:hypothetical protein
MADDEFIGRERERAQLAAPMADALAGHGSLILVAGEAGVGKTTLARQALTGSRLAVGEGFATPGGASAFEPLVEVLRAHLRSTAGGPLIEGPLVDHLALLLPELGPATREGDPPHFSKRFVWPWPRLRYGSRQRSSSMTCNGPTTRPWNCCRH